MKLYQNSTSPLTLKVTLACMQKNDHYKMHGTCFTHGHSPCNNSLNTQSEIKSHASLINNKQHYTWEVAYVTLLLAQERSQTNHIF